MVRTLYVSCAARPLRIKLTQRQIERAHKLQKKIYTLNLRNSERAIMEVIHKKYIIRIQKNIIDIGFWGPDGWDSFFYELDLKNLNELPEVYFSEMYLHYLDPLFFRERETKKFKKLILPQHKEFLVWKKIEGNTRIE